MTETLVLSPPWTRFSGGRHKTINSIVSIHIKTVIFDKSERPVFSDSPGAEPVFQVFFSNYKTVFLENKTQTVGSMREVLIDKDIRGYTYLNPRSELSDNYYCNKFCLPLNERDRRKLMKHIRDYLKTLE